MVFNILIIQMEIAQVNIFIFLYLNFILIFLVFKIKMLYYFIKNIKKKSVIITAKTVYNMVHKVVLLVQILYF